MAADQYAVVFLALDGQLLVEETEVKFKLDMQNQIMVTQQKGFAGITPGAGFVTIDLSSCVPRAGMEYDYLDALTNHRAVEATMIFAGKKWATKGFLMTLDMDGGVNKPTTSGIAFHGAIPTETT